MHVIAVNYVQCVCVPLDSLMFAIGVDAAAAAAHCLIESRFYRFGLDWNKMPIGEISHVSIVKAAINTVAVHDPWWNIHTHKSTFYWSPAWHQNSKAKWHDNKTN